MNTIIFKNKRQGLYFSIALFSTQIQAHTNDTSLYVSPSGNDQWSGRYEKPTEDKRDGPLQSLVAAKNIARYSLAKMVGNERSTLKILIAPGTYVLTSPLLFEAADSGTSENPVIWEALEKGKVKIVGGAPLLRLKNSHPGEILFSPPSASADEIKGGGQLYINETRAILARQPDEGNYWFISEPAWTKSDTLGRGGRYAFKPTSSQIQWMAKLSKEDNQRAIFHIMQSWTSSRHRLDPATSPNNDAITLIPPARDPFKKYGEKQRFYIENITSAFDKPGEWLWDASGVRYKPKSFEINSDLQGVMPTLENIIIINGDIKNGTLTHDIQFKNIGFSFTRRLTPLDGETDQQAAVDVSALIEINNARNILFDGCSISHTGGYGIWFRHRARDSKIINCVLQDLGAGGIKIGEKKQQASDKSETGNIIAKNNLITHTGQTYPGAVGILVGQSFDNEISNNTISDTTYSGISVGWDWSQGEPTSGRNLITKNLLYNIGQNHLADLGGIYTTGNSPGTIISENLIRQVHAYSGYGPGYGYGPSAWGIYNDAISRSILVENNIVSETDGASYFLNLGRDITVQGNIFSNGKSGEIFVSPTELKTKRIEITNNTIIPINDIVFSIQNPASTATFKQNIIAKSERTNIENIKPCSSECRIESIGIATSASPKDISVFGNKNTIIDKAKLISNASGSTINPETLNFYQPAADSIKLEKYILTNNSIHESDITLSGLDLIHRMEFSPEGKSQSITLIDSPTSKDKQCLKFQDSPELINKFDPHAYIRLNATQGTATSEFSILLDNNSSFTHEWREASIPYKIGPSVQIDSQGIHLKGKVVAPAAPGQWLHIKIATPLSIDEGKWQLDVTYPSGEKKTIPDIPYSSHDWKLLQWIGFISESTSDSSFCLSDIKISTHN